MRLLTLFFWFSTIGNQPAILLSSSLVLLDQQISPSSCLWTFELRVLLFVDHHLRVSSRERGKVNRKICRIFLPKNSKKNRKICEQIIRNPEILNGRKPQQGHQETMCLICLACLFQNHPKRYSELQMGVQLQVPDI